MNNTNDDELIDELKVKFEPNVLINTHLAKEIIALIQSKENDGWIPVSERLPNDMDSELTVYYKNDCAEAVTHCDAYLSHSGFCALHEGELKPIVGVTHWKERPQPPIEKEGE